MERPLHCTIPVTWRSQDTHLILSPERARGMWRRVGQWSLAEGGRFVADGESTVFIWSGGRAHTKVRPVAAFTVRPADDKVVVERVYWSPIGASQLTIWQALALLVGRGPSGT